MRKNKSSRSPTKACMHCTTQKLNTRNTRHTHPLPNLSDALSTETNRKAHWKHYQYLQKQINHAWTTLQTAVEQKAKPATILAYRNNLLLLLGECNYLAHGYMRLIQHKPFAA